jgi:hypothetical protein
MKGIQTPRNTALNIFLYHYNRLIVRQGDSVYKVTNYRNHLKWNNSNSKDRINLLNLSEGEMLVVYGGRLNSKNEEYNMHYFHESEYTSSDMTSIGNSQKTQYNSLVPHYCERVSRS